MLLVLLATLGVPIWLIVGMLASVFWSRRNFKQSPGVFPVKVRVESGEVAGLKGSWPRLAGYALWVHDVLLVHKGLALLRTLPLPVAAMDDAPTAKDSGDIKGLGDDPVTIGLSLDGGQRLGLAMPRQAWSNFTRPVSERSGGGGH